MVVLVVSSHDANDVPTFTPIIGINPAFPDRQPVLALQEAVTRYLPRYLPFLDRKPDTHNTQPSNSATNNDAIPAFLELIELIQGEGLPLIVIHHAEQSELSDGYELGHGAIVESLASLGLTPLETAPLFQQAIDAGRHPYRDNIHPNAAGQRLLAELIEEAVLLKQTEELRPETPAGATAP